MSEFPPPPFYYQAAAHLEPPPIPLDALRRGTRRPAAAAARQRAESERMRLGDDDPDHTDTVLGGGMVPEEERFKLTVYILDRRLRADGIRVSAFKQNQDTSNQWIPVELTPKITTDIENAILTRARELRRKTPGARNASNFDNLSVSSVDKTGSVSDFRLPLFLAVTKFWTLRKGSRKGTRTTKKRKGEHFSNILLDSHSPRKKTKFNLSSTGKTVQEETAVISTNVHENRESAHMKDSRVSFGRRQCARYQEGQQLKGACISS